MYSVMVTVNYGKGNEIHNLSGTYGKDALSKYMEVFLSLPKVVSIEITPSS